MAIAVCTLTCPAGVSYRWSLVNGLGVLNSTTRPAVTVTARAAEGTDTLFVNATLNGATRAGSAVTVSVAGAPVPPAGGGRPTASLGWIELDLLSLSVMVAVVGMVFLRRRRKARAATAPPDERSSPPITPGSG